MSVNGNARILVVDDVPENLRLLGAVLAPRGYDVVSTYCSRSLCATTSATRLRATSCP